MKNTIQKITAIFIALIFGYESSFGSAMAQAQMNVVVQPELTLQSAHQSFTPVMIRGMKIDPQNGFNLNFIVDSGDANPQGDDLKKESERLIKYFLTSLSIPEDELWVNLSPFEKDRITSPALTKTEMGRDLLAQDYILKQMTASLLFPEDETGKEFWNKIYEKTYAILGKTELPTDTFHKIWIVPSKIEVFAQGDTVLILNSKMKVMLEEDYLAKQASAKLSGLGAVAGADEMSEEVKTALRGVILPVIEDEVNNGRNFANLRQIYHALIMAKWFKDHLKQSILGQVFVDQKKLEGLNTSTQEALNAIYNGYLEAFKSGSEGYIREEYDPSTQEMSAKKYVTGGVFLKANDAMLNTGDLQRALRTLIPSGELSDIGLVLKPVNRAMLEEQEPQYKDPEGTYRDARRLFDELLNRELPQTPEDAFARADQISHLAGQPRVRWDRVLFAAVLVLLSVGGWMFWNHRSDDDSTQISLQASDDPARLSDDEELWADPDSLFVQPVNYRNEAYQRLDAWAAKFAGQETEMTTVEIAYLFEIPRNIYFYEILRKYKVGYLEEAREVVISTVVKNLIDYVRLSEGHIYMTKNELMQKFGVRESTLYKVMSAFPGKKLMRKDANYEGGQRLRDYLRGLPSGTVIEDATELAFFYDLSVGTVNEILREFNISTRHGLQLQAVEDVKQFMEQEFVSRGLTFVFELSAQEVADRYGISAQAARDAASSLGLVLRGTKINAGMFDQWILDKKKSGFYKVLYSTLELAKIFQMPEHQILKSLREHHLAYYGAPNRDSAKELFVFMRNNYGKEIEFTVTDLERMFGVQDATIKKMANYFDIVIPKAVGKRPKLSVLDKPVLDHSPDANMKSIFERLADFKQRNPAMLSGESNQAMLHPFRAINRVLNRAGRDFWDEI